jgi:hypothetical protein
MKVISKTKGRGNAQGLWRRFRMTAGAAVMTAAMVACGGGGDKPDDPGDESEADFISFTFEGIDGKATIDKTTGTIEASAKKTVDLEQVAPAYKITGGGKATVDGKPQESGKTKNDFTKPVTYETVSADGSKTRTWRVIVIGGKQDVKKPLTTVEQLSIRFSVNGGATRSTVLSWQRYGMRVRMDDRPEDQKAHSVTIFDHINKTFCEGYWSKDNNRVMWEDLEYVGSSQGNIEALYINEAEFAPYLTGELAIYGGKACKVYKQPTINMTFYVWDGVILKAVDNGQVMWEVTNVVDEVPDSAFTRYFEVDWI